MKTVAPALLIALMLSLPAWAAESASDVETERGRIVMEREAAHRQLRADEAVCASRWASSPCVEAARRQHRQRIADLRRQELALDDALRRRRAEDRVLQRERRAAQAHQRAQQADTDSGLPVSRAHDRSGLASAAPDETPADRPKIDVAQRRRALDAAAAQRARETARREVEREQRRREKARRAEARAQRSADLLP